MGKGHGSYTFLGGRGLTKKHYRLKPLAPKPLRHTKCSEGLARQASLLKAKITMELVLLQLSFLLRGLK